MHYRWGGHIGARALLDINLIWFDYFARLSQWGRGGISLVQMISTYSTQHFEEQFQSGKFALASLATILGKDGAGNGAEGWGIYRIYLTVIKEHRGEQRLRRLYEPALKMTEDDISCSSSISGAYIAKIVHNSQVHPVPAVTNEIIFPKIKWGWGEFQTNIIVS